MGNIHCTSIYVPNAVDGSGRKTCLLVFPSVFKCDKILIVYGSNEVQTVLHNAIEQSWRQGIDRERNFIVNYGDIKLNGKPFSANCCNSSTKAIQKTKLMRKMVEELLRSGWCIETCINFYRNSRSDSFLFRRLENSILDPKVCAVNLGSSDQIHLVGAPFRLYTVIQQIIIDYWPAGLQNHKDYGEDGCYKLILKRYPWRASYIQENLANSRMVLLEVVRAVHREGFTLLASGHAPQLVINVDTLYFSRVVDYEPMTGSFLLGIQRHDYMYTVDAPSSSVETVRQMINEYWPKGVHKEIEIRNMKAFKMYGYPWMSKGVLGSVSRLLLVHIFTKLRQTGWKIYGTVDMKLQLNDANVFIMVKCPPVNSHIMAIKLTGTKCCRLINAPRDAIDCIVQVMLELWPEGVTTTRDDGFPAFYFSKSLHNCQGIFCIIIEKLTAIGWNLISSADVSVNFHNGKYEKYPEDLHTIFFEKILNTDPV